MTSRDLHRKPTTDSLIKVTLPNRVWKGEINETVWAERLTAERCRLKNVPFYAYGVSFDDILKITVNASSIEAVGVLARAGHSTYRFFVQKGQVERALGSYWKTIEEAGCTFERATKHLFAVDVPPEADIHAVYQALETGEQAGVWEFEEGHCGHPV